MDFLTFALIAVGVLGGLIGLILAIAAHHLQIEENPLINRIEEQLPGINCGGCGYPGCHGYAVAIAESQEVITLCQPGGQALQQTLANITGQASSDKPQLPLVAFVYCNGGKKALDNFEYAGTKTCAAASLIRGGQKTCSYGCLGFGDCVKSCNYTAITMTENATPKVNPKKCINCGACYAACPKQLITARPLRTVPQTTCSSHDTGKIVRSLCKSGCIACGLCIKNCSFKAITMNNNLAVIDPLICTNCGICVQKCPTKAIGY